MCGWMVIFLYLSLFFLFLYLHFTFSSYHFPLLSPHLYLLSFSMCVCPHTVLYRYEPRVERKKNVLAKNRKNWTWNCVNSGLRFFFLFLNLVLLKQIYLRLGATTLKAEPSSLSVWCQSHLLSVAHSFLFSRSLTEPHYFFFVKTIPIFGW